MRSLILVGAAALALCAGSAQAGILRFEATLKGADAAAHARGDLTAELDTNTRVMDYTVTYSGLSGPPVGADFETAAGKSSAPKVRAGAGTASPLQGTVVLTPAQITDLNQDRWSFAIVTRAAPSGEISGVVRRTSF
jgi:hypothetical protein